MSRDFVRFVMRDIIRLCDLKLRLIETEALDDYFKNHWLNELDTITLKQVQYDKNLEILPTLE